MKKEKMKVRKKLLELWEKSNELLPSPLDLKDKDLRRIVAGVKGNILYYYFLLNNKDWKKLMWGNIYSCLIKGNLKEKKGD